MATGDYIIPGASAVSEWLSPVGGFIQGCGQAAFAVVQGIASGHPPTTEQVTGLIRDGIQAGKAGSHGSTTPSDLVWLGQQNGVPLTTGSGVNALATIESNLSRGLPTILGVNNARAFGGSDSNVSGHWVTVVGKAANGNYIVADPNTKQALSGGFVQYTADQIKRANPFATETPSGIGPVGGGNDVRAVAQAAGVLASLFSSYGVTPQEFAWRAGLIVGGMVLIVVGLLVFFSHQGQEAVVGVVQQAKSAAKAGAEAASA